MAWGGATSTSMFETFVRLEEPQEYATTSPDR
jgi:hypothetical protein